MALANMQRRLATVADSSDKQKRMMMQIMNKQNIY